MALLRHCDASGAEHFDLLLSTEANAADDDRCALCWRTDTCVAALAAGTSILLQPIARHRARYLFLTAPITLEGGRGRVEPVGTGRWQPLASGAVLMHWDKHPTPMSVRFLAPRADRPQEAPTPHIARTQPGTSDALESFDARDIERLAASVRLVREL